MSAHTNPNDYHYQMISRIIAISLAIIAAPQGYKFSKTLYEDTSGIRKTLYEDALETTEGIADRIYI